jgi:hypothetical protein
MNGTKALEVRIKRIADELILSSKMLDQSPTHPGDYEHFPNIYDYIKQEADKLTERKSIRLPPNDPAAEDATEDKRYDVDDTAFGNQISYLHNEFNFDAARPVRNFVLLTHISLIPIFAPKWPRKLELAATNQGMPQADLTTFELSPHVERRFNPIQRQSIAADGEFSGGSDAVNTYISRFMDYERKYITTDGSIDAMYVVIANHFKETSKGTERELVTRAAQEWNKKLEKSIKEQGLSSRFSMMREYALRLGRQESARLTWVRHHSHYQTITAMEEAFVQPNLLANDNEIKIPSSPTLEKIVSLISIISDSDVLRRPNIKITDRDCALSHTAFDSLPTNWADYLFGRYLQGANYLLIPAEVLFSKPYLHAAQGVSVPMRNDGETLAKEWANLIRQRPNNTRRGSASPVISYETFLNIWREQQSSPMIDRACSQFLFTLLRPLIVCTFPRGRDISAQEFCVCSASANGALIVSNVRNMTSFANEAAGTMLMSETIIVDFGMNEFERGRLLKQLTDFSTERFRSLSSLGTFRFLSDALDTVHNNLSKHVKVWLDGPPLQEGEEPIDDEFDLAESPPSDAAARRRRHQANVRRVKRDRVFAQTLKRVTIELTLINDLVEGGISAHSAGVASAVDRVHNRLSVIGERKLVGFMSLTEFLQRRFNRSVRIITSVGSRYDLLRRRVSELSSLVETHIEMSQRDDQKTLLEKVDRLTLFGLTYYFGTVLAYFLAPILVMTFFESGNTPEKSPSVEDVAEYIKMIAFGGLIIGGVVIGLDVFRVIGEELADGPFNWLRAIRGTELVKAARKNATIMLLYRSIRWGLAVLGRAAD